MRQFDGYAVVQLSAEFPHSETESIPIPPIPTLLYAIFASFEIQFIIQLIQQTKLKNCHFSIHKLGSLTALKLAKATLLLTLS